MTASSEKTLKAKVFQKGQVVIPVALRRKHRIEAGDHVDMISTPEGILIQPNVNVERRQTATERLHGIFRKYRIRKEIRLNKQNIAKATEQGFSNGWPE